MSENYRLSHSDDNVLRVYRRVVDAPPRAGGDDTSAAMVDGGAAAAAALGGKTKAGRTAAAAPERGLAKQPLRRRMFFGFLRR